MGAELTLNLWALAAFLSVAVGAAFAVGRFVRRGGSTSESDDVVEPPPRRGRAWERATTREPDYGRSTIPRRRHDEPSTTMQQASGAGPDFTALWVAASLMDSPSTTTSPECADSGSSGGCESSCGGSSCGGGGGD